MNSPERNTAPAMIAMIRAGSLMALLGAGWAHAADAPPPAVLRNSELGVAFQTIDSGGNKNNSAGAFGQMLFPLTRYFGAAIEGSFGHTNLLIDRVETTSGKASCGYDTTGLGGELFARLPSVGKVSAGYTTNRISTQCEDNASFLGDGSNSLNADGYRVAAEYYFPAVTLAASHSDTSVDGSESFTTDTFKASWYPVADLSLSPSAGRTRGTNFYGFTLEHQPDFLGRSLSLTLAYMVQNETEKANTLTLGFTYHFGTRVELKVRDRQYR
jgi:hypothetical protein